MSSVSPPLPLQRTTAPVVTVLNWTRLPTFAPVRTDGGNLIYDAACGRIEEPAALAFALKSITGVVEHGLFLDLADQALIGGDAGVTTLYP